MLCYKVWIDFNHDKDFGDAGELVLSKSISSRSSILSDFTIPATALTGTTRMRVSLEANGCATQCESIVTGEVEDYTVNIAASPALRETHFTNTPTIQVYPNPVTNELTIDADGVAEISTIRVLDITGKLITQANHIDNIRHTLSVNDWLSGVFILQITTSDGKQEFHKIVKQ
jgi:hypothetical protein